MKIGNRSKAVLALGPVLFILSICSSVEPGRRLIPGKLTARPATFWEGLRLPASEGASEGASDRAGADLQRREALESSFEALLHGSDPRAEAEQYIREVIQTFYRAQAELNRFDENLDAGRTLRDNPSYSRLLAWRSFSHLMEEKIAYFYRRLLEVRAAGAADSPQSRSAEEALAGFGDGIHAAHGADRLALQSLAEELETVQDEYRSRIEGPGGAGWALDLHQLLLSRPEELGAFAASPAVKAELKAGSRRFDGADARLNRLIEATAAGISSGIRELSAGRDPQSDGIYPDPGPHGNISGFEFPRGTWALTFDDGPLPRYSQSVLANLKAHGIKATVFEVARMAERFPEMSIAYRDYGMTMGNHSYTHPELTKLSSDGIHHEVADAESSLASILGFRPRFFRLPYGAGLHTPRVRQAIADQGMIDVFWTVDSLDWQDHDPVSIAERVRKQMRQYGRGIILFHDIHPQSVTASRLVMDELVAEHDRVVTLEEIVDELNGGH